MRRSRAVSGDIWRKLPIITSAAAGLGYSLFGPIGVVLWVPVAGLLLWAVRLVARFTPTVAATLPLLLAGIALHSASTLGWGGADAPDGTRFKVSPIGMSHVLTPHRPTSPTVDCRWYRVTDEAAPCAMAAGGTSAHRQLLAVYPLLWVAAGTCLVGILLQFWTGSRSCLAHRIVSGVAAVVPVGTGGTLGTMQVTVAILLSVATAASGALTAKEERHAEGRSHSAGSRCGEVGRGFSNSR